MITCRHRKAKTQKERIKQRGKLRDMNSLERGTALEGTKKYNANKVVRRHRAGALSIARV